MRSGVIARKLGMSCIFNDEGMRIPVTVLALDKCQVVAQCRAEKHGYTALQLGAGQAKKSRVSKAEKERFAKVKIEPKKALMEFRVDEDALIDVGAELSADHFIIGQKVDVTGRSIGKGFAGSMKRHNFRGGRATHGVSISHRAHGSTGQCQDPGRVFKGKKMAGHMGAVQKTLQNIEVIRVLSDEGLIYLKGGVPGAKNSWVKICDAVKGSKSKDLPYPASLKENKSNVKNADSKAQTESEDKAVANERAENTSETKD